MHCRLAAVMTDKTAFFDCERLNLASYFDASTDYFYKNAENVPKSSFMIIINKFLEVTNYFPCFVRG